MVFPEGGCWRVHRAVSGSLLSRPQEPVFLSGSCRAELGPVCAAAPTLSRGGRAPAVALLSEDLLCPLRRPEMPGQLPHRQPERGARVVCKTEWRWWLWGGQGRAQPAVSQEPSVVGRHWLEI